MAHYFLLDGKRPGQGSHRRLPISVSAERTITQHLAYPLRDDKHGYWRYRVSDSRLLCMLENSLLIVVVVAVGHRSSV